MHIYFLHDFTLQASKEASSRGSPDTANLDFNECFCQCNGIGTFDFHVSLLFKFNHTSSYREADT